MPTQHWPNTTATGCSIPYGDHGCFPGGWPAQSNATGVGGAANVFARAVQRWLQSSLQHDGGACPNKAIAPLNRAALAQQQAAIHSYEETKTMYAATRWILLGAILGGYTGAVAGGQQTGPAVQARLSAVPFTQVKVRDAFWAPRLATNREVSIPHNFEWCEKTGRFSNFDKATGRAEGKFEGIYFNDSDVYKVLEGASYSLADHPDPKLEEMVDRVIARIAAAQQADGYLNTYYTLVEPGNRWTNCRVRHELYCAGHLFEAAVAHWRATGSRTLLDVATRFADHIAGVFGPDLRYDVPGHEEIELALVKLYEATGQEKYLRLARFFIDIRGDRAKREVYGDYCQDHIPVREQSEIVGHAVRAMYLYCGVADIAARTGDRELFGAMDRIWRDVTERKMYITGGIGARHAGEAFGDPYELPNASAYCETCAAIGLALWAHRMNLLHGDAQYADVLERVVYNGFLSGVGMDGKLFFYVNPLESSGGHHRQPFYPCACCPTNVVRFIPSLPGYIYAVDDEGLYVNLYVAGTAEVLVAGQSVAIEQQTRYPWEGDVRLVLRPEKPAQFTVALRIPGWAASSTVSVNGESLGAGQLQRGYARVQRTWQPGDVIELELPMEPVRMEAHPQVTADRGRVAVQRGPIVYCFEAVDNGGRVRNRILAQQAELRAEFRPDLLGGVVVVTAKDRDGDALTAVPYYAWDHREPGEMIVWIRQDGKTRRPDLDDPAWQGKLYRPLDPRTLGPSEPLAIAELATPSASYCNAPDGPAAMNDQLEPSESCDHTIPRFTWWDHRGTREWVQYDFDKPRRVSAVEVYWFDDGRINRHCRVPASWQLLYREGDQWKPVTGAGKYGTAKDQYNRVTFDPVETSALRIEVQLDPSGPWSGGILEWKVE